MKYASVCSGIGAPECAWQSFKDWECVFHAEIESFPAAIYGQHFNSKNYGDIAKFKEWPEHAIDLLVGGTPCQSFSVAGLRKGLDDPRGNLALVFLGIVDRYRPAWVLWENVPGVHSSWSDESLRPQSEECQNTVDEIRRLGRQLGIDSIATIGNSEVEEVNQTSDFDCFLSGLEQLGYGVATTILDAQYRGLAQRRERVFVVGCAGGQWQRAAAVLFDWSCVRGDSAPSRETGQRIAPTVESRANAGGAGWGTDFLAGGGV